MVTLVTPQEALVIAMHRAGVEKKPTICTSFGNQWQTATYTGEKSMALEVLATALNVQYSSRVCFNAYNPGQCMVGHYDDSDGGRPEGHAYRLIGTLAGDHSLGWADHIEVTGRNWYITDAGMVKHGCHVVPPKTFRISMMVFLYPPLDMDYNARKRTAIDFSHVGGKEIQTINYWFEEIQDFLLNGLTIIPAET